MQRVVALLSQLLVGSHGHEHIRGLHRDFELVEVVVLQNFGMLKGGFNQRVGVRLAVFFEQMLF